LAYRASPDPFVWFAGRTTHVGVRVDPQLLAADAVGFNDIFERVDRDGERLAGAKKHRRPELQH